MLTLGLAPLSIWAIFQSFLVHVILISQSLRKLS